MSQYLIIEFTRLPAPPEIGTDGLATCVGVYFELAGTSPLFIILFLSPSLMVSLECFVGHLDTGSPGGTVPNITKLAKYARDQFYDRIKSKFPSESFSQFQNLVQVTAGDETSTALCWGVNEAFKKMVTPSYVFQDPPPLSRVSEAKTLWGVGQKTGNAFIAKNRAVTVPSATTVLTPSGTFGTSGFTFTAP
jgi:hypothetical protein